MNKSTQLKIGCVVMAAGGSSRFGRNKLLEEFNGSSLIARALAAVPADILDRTAVVTGYPEVHAMAKAANFETVWNDRPEAGVSLTIRLGLDKMNDMDAAMFMVCDQPLLTRASVSAMVEFFIGRPDHIVGMAHSGERGNPCIFPSEFFPELRRLEGDAGGSAVIRRHTASLLLFEADNAAELMDVDRASDFWNSRFENEH